MNFEERKMFFTPRQKKNILELALKYKNIIENKKTDGVTNKLKVEVWQAIADEFNALTTDKRTAKQLRTFYANTKKKIRKQKAQEQEVDYDVHNKPGPSTSVALLPSEEKILSLMKYECDEESDNIGYDSSSPGILKDEEIQLLQQEISANNNESLKRRSVNDLYEEISIAAQIGKKAKTSTESNYGTENCYDLDTKSVNVAIKEQQLREEKRIYDLSAEEKELQIGNLRLERKIRLIELETKLRDFKNKFGVNFDPAD